MLAPVAARTFEVLGIGASLWYLGSWLDLHERTSTLDFEVEHAMEVERWSYNDRCLLQVRQSRRAVVGQHGALSDLFVPVLVGAEMAGVIVVGPFLTALPSGAAVLERWRALTGRQGELSEPEFAGYLAALLALPLLEDTLAQTLQRLVECLAELMAGTGSARALYLEVESLRDELFKTRLHDRMWDAARAMVDERTTRLWVASCRDGHLWHLGVRQFPKHVLVGFFTNEDRASDALGEALRMEGFRRACVRLAYDARNVVAGRIGDSGVSFLMSTGTSAQRSRARLLDLARRATLLARKRFGLSLHLGASMLPGALSSQYQAALAAAEVALARGIAVVQAGSGVRRQPRLAPYRDELARAAEETPESLAPRFDRYLEVVAQRCAGRIDAARAELDATFDRIAETLVRSGAAEARRWTEISRRMEGTTGNITRLDHLLSAFRVALHGLVETGRRKPAPSRHQRSLGRAEAYMREHRAEPLTRAKVAKVAGFAETYFSELFHEKQGKTFGQHLTDLRIEHAKRLLMDTSLGMQRIAELSGFRTRQYLSRVFKTEAGETPLKYRLRVLKGHAPYEYVP
jgi:AraC-like DNA-binding protein